jgi:hypothetical protein
MADVVLDLPRRAFVRRQLGEAVRDDVLRRLPAFSACAHCRASSGVSFVTTTSLTIAAGAWSHMPMQGVYSSEKASSAEVSPTLMPSSCSKASATAGSPRTGRRCRRKAGSSPALSVSAKETNRSSPPPRPRSATGRSGWRPFPSPSAISSETGPARRAGCRASGAGHWRRIRRSKRSGRPVSTAPSTAGPVTSPDCAPVVMLVPLLPAPAMPQDSSPRAVPVHRG